MTEKIKSEVVVKATASLEEQVQKELEVKDPTTEKAQALLKDNEITSGNDRRRSS